MGHVTKQERKGLEELFISIEHNRYHSKFDTLKKAAKHSWHLIKISLFKPTKK